MRGPTHPVEAWSAHDAEWASYGPAALNEGLSAMVAMSRAIRGVLEPYGEKLSEFPTEVLREVSNILNAYAGDLAAELRRREESDSGA